MSDNDGSPEGTGAAGLVVGIVWVLVLTLSLFAIIGAVVLFLL